MPAHIKVPNFAAEAAATAEKELGAAEEALEQLCDQSAQDLYANVVTDVLRIRQARENYAVVLEKVEQLPQLFLGA